jgi:predicted lipoprotein with Yx(FWY)xxD motif
MRIRMTLLAAPALMLGLGLAACGGPAGQATMAAAGTPAAAAPMVKVSQTTAGRVLTDQSGRTLYAFTYDKNKPAMCDGDCVAVWPVLVGHATAGDGASASLLGTVKEGEDETQVTYKGWPLYYYVGDVGADDVNGTGVDDAWFPVAPDGSLIKAQP